MEKLSRVEKYEKLRSQIEYEPIENNTEKTIPTVFKKLDITDDQPKREKEIKLPKNDSDTFINEYMDDLIRDVKQYNKEKGLLHSEITEVDILNQLKNPTRLKREDYVKTIEEKPKVDENTIIQSKKQIAMQIQELLNEDDHEGMMVSKVEPEINDQEVKEHQNEQDLLPNQKVYSDHVDHIQLLNEQTQQMKIKIDQQEEELNDLSVGIDKTNRLLNMILIFLVIALLAVIGATIYMILKNGGRI